MICVLKVVSGPAAGIQCWLNTEQSVTIGRQGAAGLRIANDPHLSRKHLVVEGISGGFRLRDIGSSNGTFVNDVSVSVIELCIGDRIRAGSSVFTVDINDSDAEPAEIGDLPQVDLPDRKLFAKDVLEIGLDEQTHRLNTYEQPEANAPIGQQSPEIPSATVSEPVIEDETPPNARQSLPADSHDEASGRNHKDTQQSRGLNRGSPSVPSILADFSWDDFDESSHSPKILRAATPNDANRVIDALVFAERPTLISLIVNSGELVGRQRGSLEQIVQTGKARKLTHTLFFVSSENKALCGGLYKQLIGTDSAILIGSEIAPSDAWLKGHLNELSYPSMFCSMLRDDPGARAAVLSEAQMLLAEPDAEGNLYLLY